MLYFQWEIIYSIKKLRGIFQMIVLGTLFFLKWLGPLHKEGKYSRNYMLSFPLLWAVNP